MNDRHASRGQGLVEFAIVIPIIILIVLGLLDLGRAIFSYNTLAQSARAGSRMAIVDQRVDEVRAAAIAAAPTLGLTSSDVSVCFKDVDTSLHDCASSTDDCPQASRVIGCQAIVVVTTTYSPLTPVISTIWSSVALTSTSMAPIEYVCPYDLHTTCP